MLEKKVSTPLRRGSYYKPEEFRQLPLRQVFPEMIRGEFTIHRRTDIHSRVRYLVRHRADKVSIYDVYKVWFDD